MALFGGGKPDHPMADPKQARELISEFPANDATKGLEEVTFWLDSVSRTEGFKLDYRYELYDLLDQAAKNHQRKLSQEYLATDRQEKFRESKLWTTVFEFWKTLGSCYNQCVEQFQAGASGAGAIKKYLPAIVARALRALTLQLKWSSLRYGPVDDRVWSELGRLYLFAESKRFATTAIDIYPGLHGQGTVEQEFLKALMLGVSSTDGLTPLKQEIAERTVAHFGKQYLIQAKPGPECNYYFDLSMRKAAARAMKSIEPNPMIRYFGAGKALPGLHQLIGDIKAKEGVPSDVNLGGTYDNDLVLSVMGHLAMYWSDKPPARGSERRKIATRLTVVHGMGRILHCIRPPEEDVSLDFQAKDGGESWIVENVSAGGFGAIVQQLKGDWLKVGALIVMQPEGGNNWVTGLIRRVNKVGTTQARVGIQSLSNAPMVASFWTGVTTEKGVLLKTGEPDSGEVRIVLKPGVFVPGQNLESERGGRFHVYMPQAVEDKGDDYEIARFREMIRES